MPLPFLFMLGDAGALASVADFSFVANSTTEPLRTTTARVGDSELVAGLIVNRIRVQSGGATLTLNRTGATSFSGWKSGAGVGTRWTFTAHGVSATLETSDANAGNGFFQWTIPAADRAVFAAIGAGDTVQVVVA